MNEWLLTAVALTAALAPLGILCARARPMEALVALNLAGVIAPVVMMLIATGTKRQPFADLAIVLALLSLAGSVAYARFLERTPEAGDR
jgi:multicomponent Na+:H+ antiporter subunit F